jgi:hypothetical protein
MKLPKGISEIKNIAETLFKTIQLLLAKPEKEQA